MVISAPLFSLHLQSSPAQSLLNSVAIFWFIKTGQRRDASDAPCNNLGAVKGLNKLALRSPESLCLGTKKPINKTPYRNEMNQIRAKQMKHKEVYMEYTLTDSEFVTAESDLIAVGKGIINRL